eukprot:gb/GECH01009880.1/.p1 GENE.gb/GECH01009880.1/~~gb/GECH01009880.1/.p1  ORF type:complete len:634 (+),score=170.54 gb/GECH01009880.1/:1-1902(+)
MFKKTLPTPAASNLRTSIAKKFKHTLVKQFPALGEGDPRYVDELIPSKGLTQNKVKVSDTEIVYVFSVDNVPLFVDCSGGRGDYYPTIYALWRFPPIVPTFYIYPETSTFILGGADLMLPGILQPPGGLGEFRTGDKRSITVVGNPVPFAVGNMALSSKDARRQKFQGKALYVVHMFHDALWRFCGAQGHPQWGIPEGFQVDKIRAISSPKSNSNNNSDNKQNDDHSSQNDNLESSVTDNDNSNSNNDIKNNQTESISSNHIHESSNQNESTATTSPSNDQETAAPSSSLSSSSSISSEEMDRFLLESFMDSIVNKLNDADLPVNVSTLYSSYMQSWEGGPRVDVKKSSYKKISKFLKEMSKHKLISVKGDLVTRIHRQSSEYTTYKERYAPPPSSSASKGNKSKSNKNGKSSESGGGGGGNSTKKDTRIQVYMALGSMPKPLAPIAGVIHTKDVLFDPKEIGPLLRNYIKEHNLTREKGKSVELDKVLRHLFSNSQPGELRSQKQVSEAFKNSFVPLHIVRDTVTGETITHKKQLKKVEIIVEQRMGRKKVSRILNLSSYPGMDIQGIAQTLQKQLATSTSVSDMPGKGQGKEILCQGHLLKQLVNFLVEQCGIPQKSITTNDKTKKKKKKN